MDPFLKLAELLIKLLETRKQRRERRYKEVTSKLYDMAKETYADFVTIFRDIEKKIQEGKATNDLIEKITSDRYIKKGTRDHMRTILASIDTSDLSQFEFAIYDLLRGGMHHALRHLVQQLAFNDILVQKPRSQPFHETNIRNEHLEVVRNAIETVEIHWDAVNAAYKVHLRQYLKS